MFALAADFLMGWAMASGDGARKLRAEWPPHPDRVFMALAAAWFETGSDAAEGEALRWLETLPPPALCASGHAQRDPVTHYVPVNDAGLSSYKAVTSLIEAVEFAWDKAKDTGLSQLPEWRSRQPRSFPVAIPHHPVLHLCWQTDAPERHRAALARLCAKVTCIGHSASVVRMWIDDTPPRATWIPGDGPMAMRMRVCGPGRLSYLEQRLNKQAVLAHAEMKQALLTAKGKVKQQLQRALDERFPSPPVSLRPEPGLWQAYIPATAIEAPATPCDRSVFDERLVVLSLNGPRLGLRSTLKVTAALRGAMLAGCSQPLPGWLSGHDAQGAPLREPHVALLPLAFTGAPHADGRLLGVALALPRSVSAAEAARVLEPWLRDASDGQPREFRLFDGRALECSAMLELRERVPRTLNVREWIGPSRRWATVTPIALDRHVGGPGAWDRAAETVADACERIGLPRPMDVLLHPNSLIEGAPPARSFEPIVRKRDGGRLAQTHAVLTFANDVLGPLTLGAGRFRGYGLCKPVRGSGGQDE